MPDPDQLVTVRLHDLVPDPPADLLPVEALEQRGRRRTFTVHSSVAGSMAVVLTLIVIGAGQLAGFGPLAGSSATSLALSRTFSEPHLPSFRYPASWRLSKDQASSNMFVWFASLSNQPLVKRCSGTPPHVRCAGSVPTLNPGGVYVSWMQGALPGWSFDRSRGQALVVDHQKARLLVGPADANCDELPADRQVTGTVFEDVGGLVTMNACIRGPNADRLVSAAVAMFRSVKLPEPP